LSYYNHNNMPQETLTPVQRPCKVYFPSACHSVDKSSLGGGFPVVEKTMKDLKQIGNGLLLAPEKREQLKSRYFSIAAGTKEEKPHCAITGMSDNMINFQQNLNEDQTALFFTRDELDGLPQDFIDGLQKRTVGCPFRFCFFLALKVGLNNSDRMERSPSTGCPCSTPSCYR